MSLTADNKSVNHILNDSELVICLVCRENITGVPNLDHNMLLSNHINTRKHKHKVRALFKQCIPSWSGCWAELVKDLLFDVSFERKESSFVIKTSDNFACLVCQENIAQGTDPKKIITSIVNHVQSDLHSNEVKNVPWVYPLDDNLGFIMFQNSVVYCSLCTQIVQNVITCPMKRAVEHLKVCHNSLYQTVTKPQNKDGCGDEKSICESLKSLTLSDNKPPLIPQSSSSQKNLVPEFSLDTRECETDELEASAVSHVNLDESEESSNESDVICVEDLLCPECGELIEVYNENADFSMTLHLQKHKPLMSFYTEGEFDYQEDADYVCPICQETVQIFNKDLELSIDRHFQEKRHEYGKFTLEDCSDKNKFDFLSRVFDSLPDNMRDQQSVFVMDGNEVFCKLCNCKVLSSKILSEACQVFIEHTKSTFHVGQFKASSQFLAMAVLTCNQQSLPLQNPKEKENVFKMLCKQNPLIERNKQFIEHRQMHYYCTLCKKYVSFSPKEKTQVLNFALHLSGEVHKTLWIKSISQRYPPININQNFIKEKDLDFLCDICQVPIKFTETGSVLRKHFLSDLHNTKLSEKAFCCVAKFDCKELTKPYKKVLNGIFSQPHFKPHAHFIKHDGEDFWCIICNMSIPGSTSIGKRVLNHLLSSQHRKKCFDITCNKNSRKAELKSEDKSEPLLSKYTREKDVNAPKEPASTKAEINLLQKRATKNFRFLLAYSPVIKKYARFISIVNGNFFCKICQEIIKCTSKGSKLKQHFQRVKHDV